MFYRITASNREALYAWASDSADVERYVDWLNRDFEFNLYAASEVEHHLWPEMEVREDVMSMDEPHWDEFMTRGSGI